MLEFHPAQPPTRGTVEIDPDLTVVDIENAVGSRLMLIELGLAPPLLVEGRYRLLRLLGRGARGLVCRAHDVHLNREVALKLYPAYEAGPVSHEVTSEAQALARLKHGNVVGVYDFGDTSLNFEHGELGTHDAARQTVVVPCFYMSMELIPGQSLRRWLASRELDRYHVLAVFAQAAIGLAHAHEAGVVHRDFKPENVMIDESGRVVVVDFGLARRRGATQGPPTTTAALVRWQPPSVVGTPEYMAPEARIGQANAASDQYSFAVSLHEALTGSLPPVSSAGVVYVEPQRFPGAVGRVLTRGLALDTADRYPDMGSLLAELPQRWDDQWRWTTLADEPPRPRSPPWVALSIVFGALVIGSLGVWAGAKLFGDAGSAVTDSASGLIGSECPAATVLGRWQLESLDLWDFKLSRRRVRGHYDLLVERPDPARCEFEATLSKVGSSIHEFGQPLVGRAPLRVEGPDPAGRVQLGGDWVIHDDDSTQHVEFELFVVGDELRGNYQRYLTSPDGIERRSMLGPASGARWGQPRSQVQRVDEVPCVSQCNILCAGPAAAATCHAVQCTTFNAQVDDCGPPSETFVAPFTTDKKLREFEAGEWRAVSQGKPCRELPALMAGSWTVWERSNGGAVLEWALELGAEGCGLVGTASVAGERHEVIVEFDQLGRWLVRDRQDADALVWALQGWEFAVGSAGGDRPGRLSAFKRR